MQADLRPLPIAPSEFSRLSGMIVQDTERDRAIFPRLGGAAIASFTVFAISTQIFHNPILDILLGILPLGGALFWLVWGMPELRPLEAQLTAEVSPATLALYAEVQQFNQVVRSIDVSDQLQAAGNPGLSKSTRKNLIQALQWVRQDLIRAIKTERILRENQGMIDDLLLQKSDLFTNNLASLQTLQLQEQASEVTAYLDQAVQIALEVRDGLLALQPREQS